MKTTEKRVLNKLFFKCEHLIKEYYCKYYTDCGSNISTFSSTHEYKVCCFYCKKLSTCIKVKDGKLCLSSKV